MFPTEGLLECRAFEVNFWHIMDGLYGYVWYFERRSDMKSTWRGPVLWLWMPYLLQKRWGGPDSDSRLWFQRPDCQK